MASARSSFATNFDQGVLFPNGRSSVTLQSGITAPPMPENAAFIAAANSNSRTSLISIGSNGDGDNAQTLLVPQPEQVTQLSPISVRPFTPSESWSFPKPPPPVSSPQESSHSHGEMVSLVASASAAQKYLDIESTGNEYHMVCRPFVPTLADEIAVKRGDRIRVSALFDDGWARVHKDSGEIGLIPVDCLREADEDLPDYLAIKRKSTYSNVGLAS